MMFFFGTQPAMSQGFLSKIKKAVKKVENVVGSVGETVNSVDEAVNDVKSTLNGTNENTSEATVDLDNLYTKANRTKPQGGTGSVTVTSQRKEQKSTVTALKSSSNVKILGLKIDNLGVGGRLVRMRDAGIFVDDSGVHLEGKINLQLSGYAGKRLVTVLNVCDEDDNLLADNNGELCSLTALQVASNNCKGTVDVDIPYTWVDLEHKPTTLNFVVSIFDFGQETPVLLSQSLIKIDASTVTIDRSNLPNKMMGDLLGGGKGGGLDAASLLFGSGDTAEHTCSKCDGTKVCEYCDGDAFLNPSVCRKCAQDPGICRACKGTGTQVVELDIY